MARARGSSHLPLSECELQKWNLLFTPSQGMLHPFKTFEYPLTRSSLFVSFIIFSFPRRRRSFMSSLVHAGNTTVYASSNQSSVFFLGLLGGRVMEGIDVDCSLWLKEEFMQLFITISCEFHLHQKTLP